jgi:integrase/recombinase XerD
MTALVTTLQTFFTDRMARQRQVSPNTLAAYRDALRLLLVFAADKKGKEPSKLDIDDLDAPLISAFLDDLEHQRKNGARTRNARLAAIRSLFRYAALRHPDHAALIARVLAIPPKRFDRRLVTFLTEPEISALLAAPDLSTWTGRRDHTLFGLAAQSDAADRSPERLIPDRRRYPGARIARPRRGIGKDGYARQPPGVLYGSG